MKTLRALITLLVIFVFPASSMSYGESDAIKNAVETIERCHTKAALFYNRTSLDSILDSQPYNLCVIIIATTNGECIPITLQDIENYAPDTLHACLNESETETKFAVFKNHSNDSNFFKKAKNTSFKINSALKEMMRQNLGSIGMKLPEDPPYRWTDAEEIAFYALQQLFDSEFCRKQPLKGSKIILVTLMNTCHFCGHSTAGFLRRYNEHNKDFFSGIDIHWIVPHVGKDSLSSSIPGITYYKVPIDTVDLRKDLANRLIARSLELLLYHDEYAMRNTAYLIKSLCSQFPDIEIPPQLALRLMQGWFTEAIQLFQIPQFIDALGKNFSDSVASMHPDFAIDFVTNCFEDVTRLLRIDQFTELLCKTLPENIISRKMSPNTAVWFMEEAFNIPKAVDMLLKHPSYVALLCQAWPANVLPKSMHPGLFK